MRYTLDPWPFSGAVKIKNEASNTSNILKSKAEYPQLVLASLVTRIGNKEQEIKAFEKEIKEDKKLEDEIERRIGVEEIYCNKGIALCLALCLFRSQSGCQ